MRKPLPAFLSILVLLTATSIQAADVPAKASLDRKADRAVAPATPAPAAPAAPAAEPKKAPPAPPATPEAALRADIERILAEAGLAKTLVSARVIVLGEAAAAGPAEGLYNLRSDVPFIPASTMKLFTTAACFDRLGPDWRIRTHVGRIPSADKAAKWDLAVIGGGDPNFSGRFWNGDVVGAFRRWADVLKARGVTALGRVVLDDSLFDPLLQHPRWPFDQRAAWYEAPVSALNLNDNCVEVRVSPGKVGEPAVVRLDPPGAYAVVEGAILTVAARKDHSFAIARLDDPGPGGAMRLKVSGRFAAGAAEADEFRTVLDPTAFFGAALAETLRAEGIAVAGPVVRERLTAKDGCIRGDFECDVVHASRLDVTASVANKRSQALYAECLLKILGAFGANPKCEAPLPPVQGSWTTGPEEVRRWLAERNIPAEGCVFDDGSGLSKENRLSALAVTELLRVMFERHADAFMQTLSVAGQDGTLAKRMHGTAAAGRVFGKTGYVNGASALSGYVRTKTGKVLAFSILMNDVPRGDPSKARDAQDKVCLRLVEY